MDMLQSYGIPIMFLILKKLKKYAPMTYIQTVRCFIRF